MAEPGTATLLATVDQLQAEVNQLYREYLILTVAITALSVIVALGLRARK